MENNCFPFLFFFCFLGMIFLFAFDDMHLSRVYYPAIGGEQVSKGK
jgi:hypothetical protein